MAKGNHLTKITTRARQIRKAHPSMQWKNAVRKASAEYRNGSIGAAKPKKKKTYQTGKSTKLNDAKRKAKKPGKRTSATGRKYTERRKNRSDIPGTLTGMSVGALGSALRTKLKEKLGKDIVRREFATTAKGYRAASDSVKQTRSQLNRLL